MAALVAAAMLAAIIVGLVALAAVMGWGGPMLLWQRIGLCAMAAGLVGAGIGRALQWPVGWFDVMFLAGIAGYFAATYGPAILRRADAADGANDGRLKLATGRSPKAQRMRR